MTDNKGRRSRKRHPDDDGRVIAPMNVEGMPWHDRREALPATRGGETLSKRQTRYAMAGALKAALLVVAVLSAGMILLVLLTLKLWVK
ncbi:MAG: hypothetical protein AB9880_04585 [Christensenellales bacterium]